MNDKTTSRDHRWALGLCALLVLLLVGGTIGAWVYGARRQRAAVAALTDNPTASASLTPYSAPPRAKRSGLPAVRTAGHVRRLGKGSVEYGYQLDDNLDPIAGDPPGPEWLRDWLGIDYLATVRGATIHELSEDSLEALGTLTGLRSLEIQSLWMAQAGRRRARGLPGAGRVVVDTGPSIGPVMSLLPNFTVLEKLVLAGVTATEDDLAVLPKLPRLRVLDISDCPAIGDAALGHVSRIAGLKSLSLTGQPKLTEAGMAQLGGLEKLETLRLDARSHALGLKSLNGLANLEELQCSGLNDEGFASLTRAPKLKKLSLVDCQALSWAGLKHVGDFPSLEVLYFALVPGLDDDALAGVVRLPKLRELVIQGQISRLTDKGLEALSHSSSLRTLFLFGCRDLTDAGLVHLAAMKNLEQLNLRAYTPDQFSVEAIDDLRKGLPKCKIEYEAPPHAP